MEKLRAQLGDLGPVRLGPAFTVGLALTGYGLVRRRRTLRLVGVALALGEASRGIYRARQAALDAAAEPQTPA